MRDSGTDETSSGSSESGSIEARHIKKDEQEPLIEQGVTTYHTLDSDDSSEGVDDSEVVSEKLQTLLHALDLKQRDLENAGIDIDALSEVMDPTVYGRFLQFIMGTSFLQQLLRTPFLIRLLLQLEVSADDGLESEVPRLLGDEDSESEPNLIQMVDYPQRTDSRFCQNSVRLSII